MEFVMFSPPVYPAGFCLNTDIKNLVAQLAPFLRGADPTPIELSSRPIDAGPVN